MAVTVRVSPLSSLSLVMTLMVTGVADGVVALSLMATGPASGTVTDTVAVAVSVPSVMV